MDKNRVWVVGTILAMVSVLGGGWFLGVSPQLAATATAKLELNNVLAISAKNQLLLAKLKRDYEHIDVLKYQLATLRQAVPSTANIPTFVTELNSLATVRQVTLKSITVSDAKAYTAAEQVPPTVEGKSASVPRTNPLVTSKNFVIIPVQITVSGDYEKVLDFVNDAQLGQRLFLVSSLSSKGSTDSKSAKGGSHRVDSSIGGSIYVLPPQG